MGTRREGRTVTWTLSALQETRPLIRSRQFDGAAAVSNDAQTVGSAFEIAGHVVSSQYVKVGLDAFPLVKALSDRCFAMPEFASSHPFEQPDYKAAGAKH